MKDGGTYRIGGFLFLQFVPKSTSFVVPNLWLSYKYFLIIVYDNSRVIFKAISISVRVYSHNLRS